MRFLSLVAVAIIAVGGVTSVMAQSSAGPAPKAATGSVSSPTSWEKFAPAGSGFSVLLPGKVTSQEQLVDRPNGKMPHYISYASLGDDAFLVTYMRFPDSITDAASIKLMLDSGRDQGVAASGAILKSETQITLDGYAGREWLMALPKGIKAQARAYWVDKTLYQVIVVSSEMQTPAAAQLTTERSLRFFNSFKLDGALK